MRCFQYLNEIYENYWEGKQKTEEARKKILLKIELSFDIFISSKNPRELVDHSLTRRTVAFVRSDKLSAQEF